MGTSRPPSTGPEPATPAAPSGLTRRGRGRRLSDQETRDRVLAAAIAVVERDGLTVSLDHLSFEEIIRAADVSRSSAYRHWPYKDLFVIDLVKELARSSTPGILRDELDLVRTVVEDHRDWLVTPELRHGLVLELIRQLTSLDVVSVAGSPAWRTYLALRATVTSLPRGELRTQVAAALAEAEEARLGRVALAWEQLAALFGYRLRPELDMTFSTLAQLLSATLEGVVIAGLADPEVADHTTSARPSGALSTEPWSLGALGAAGLALSFLEPDPAAHWDDRRLAEIHAVLDAWEVREVQQGG